jgi:hypothetical protein
MIVLDCVYNSSVLILEIIITSQVKVIPFFNIKKIILYIHYNFSFGASQKI